MTQEVEPCIAIARSIFECGKVGGVLQTRSMETRDVVGECGAAGVGIEQFALCAAADQGLEFVLTVDFGERLADLPQHLQRHLLSVEIRARFALAGDDPAHDEFVVALDALLFEQRTQACRGGAHFEGGRDFGALGTMADAFGAGTRAHCKL